MDLSDLRTDYEAEGLDPASLSDDPYEQFEAWFADAQAAGDPEPWAMTLSTVDADGRPRGRNVLLRGVDQRGFVFYTNYESAKARALDATGVAALTFHWHGLHRQVHVEGTVERVTAEESDAYFAKRPRESRLGAWASAQSTELESRAVLIDRLMEVAERFDGVEVPRPEFWGGYRVRPDRIEFWQGQPSRLHDRVRYLLDLDRARGGSGEVAADLDRARGGTGEVAADLDRARGGTGEVAADLDRKRRAKQWRRAVLSP